MNMVYGKRRFGNDFCNNLSIAESLLCGKTVFLASLDNKYPDSVEVFLKKANIKFTIEAEFTQPNMKIDYNWNGSIRRVYQPKKIQTGYIIKPIKTI